jgi:hypothetical protein
MTPYANQCFILEPSSTMVEDPYPEHHPVYTGFWDVAWDGKNATLAPMHPSSSTFPLPLSSYPAAAGGLLETLASRLQADPFNGVAVAIFLLAVLHTFFAARFTEAAHHLQQRHDAAAARAGIAPVPSVTAELLHFFGEVEVVFGLWVVPLVLAIVATRGWETAVGYLNFTVSYTEPLFVVVIMALASTKPVIDLAEAMLRRIARLGGETPGAWWVSILIVGPLLGSLITEPGAMTISALLLARQFYERQPRPALKYATLGLLFVNVSIGGTLTHFAAPPVLMVARPWGWDTPFMLQHFGGGATFAVIASTLLYYVAFKRDFRALAQMPVERAAAGSAGSKTPIPLWITAVYLLFMAWTVANAHYPAMFIGGFLFFLGFNRATAAYSASTDVRTPLLVGFFLAGLVVHGGLQAWWIAPVLSRLSETPLFFGAMILTSFNDNALITYLSTLVPNLSDSLKYAVVEGAVAGGGLTVIANAPNPAGQAVLGRFFEDAVHPLHLLAGALIPTLIASACFRLF